MMNALRFEPAIRSLVVESMTNEHRMAASMMGLPDVVRVPREFPHGMSLGSAVATHVLSFVL
jgi:hypothetical protein